MFKMFNKDNTPKRPPLEIIVKNGGMKYSRVFLVAAAAFVGGGVMLGSDSKEEAENLRADKIVPVVELKGTIMAGRSGSIMQPGQNLNIDSLRPVIDKAFDAPGAVAVVLDINSPGGSPTQSEMIADHIRMRAAEKKIPVYAFVQDVAASGGYWIACAANEIYTAKTSTVGSIGVITSGMGYAELAQKLGVESRTHTAGKSKSKLDPMKPEKPEEVAELKKDLDELHGLFKSWIKECRGDKIVKPGVDLDNDVFTGKTWIGESAHKIGLTDGVARMEPFIKKKFGNNVELVPVTVQSNGLLPLLMGAFSKSGTPEVSMTPEAIGRGIAEGTAAEMEKKAIWGPYQYR